MYIIIYCVSNQETSVCLRSVCPTAKRNYTKTPRATLRLSFSPAESPAMNFFPADSPARGLSGMVIFIATDLKRMLRFHRFFSLHPLLTVPRHCSLICSAANNLSSASVASSVSSPRSFRFAPLTAGFTLHPRLFPRRLELSSASGTAKFQLIFNCIMK